MKKIVLFVAIACFSIGLNAQCTPDPIILTLGAPGIYPNQATGGMGDGTINQPYAQTFTVVVPADTTIVTPFGTYTLAIDALEVTAVDGLPAGLSYTCDASGCSWVGGNNGCFKVDGTPTQGGDFTVDVQTTITVTIPVIGPFTSPPFPSSNDLHIEDPNSVANLENGGFHLGAASPNPFNGSTTIDFNCAKQGAYLFTVSDLNGRAVHRSDVNATAGRNVLEFDGSKLASGIYHFRFEQNGAFATGKLVIAK